MGKIYNQTVKLLKRIPDIDRTIWFVWSLLDSALVQEDKEKVVGELNRQLKLTKLNSPEVKK